MNSYLTALMSTLENLTKNYFSTSEQTQGTLSVSDGFSAFVIRSESSSFGSTVFTSRPPFLRPEPFLSRWIYHINGERPSRPPWALPKLKALFVMLNSSLKGWGKPASYFLCWVPFPNLHLNSRICSTNSWR